MELLLTFVVATIVSMVLVPPLARCATWLHVLDAPGGRKAHDYPVPRVGGIAMAAGMLLPLLLWLPMDRTLWAYFAALAVLLVYGVWDDRSALSARTKLIGQSIAVLIVMLAGDVSVDALTLTERVDLPQWLGFALTFFFLIGITNAINLTDGLDGLAGGTTLLCCAAITFLGESWMLPQVTTIGVALMGAIVGFLRFNTWPARVFMGDAGSQFLGFTVGVLSILLTRHQASPLSTALPLLLLGLPVLDTLSVMVLRVLAGRSPFSADRRHFHHRLLALGFDHHEAVIVIYTLQIALLLAGWTLRFESDLLILGVFLAFAVVFHGTLLTLERGGWRWRRAAAEPGRPASPLGRAITRLTSGKLLWRWSMRVAWLCTSSYLLTVAALAAPLPMDIGWLAALCLLALVAGYFLRASPLADTWLLRGSLYVAVATAVWLDHSRSVTEPLLQLTKWALLPLLALSVAIAIRYSQARSFRTTPMDLLLVFGAIVLPNLPGLVGAPVHIGLSIAKLVALFFAVEMLSTLSTRLRTALLAAAGSGCLLIVLRAF